MSWEEPPRREWRNVTSRSCRRSPACCSVTGSDRLAQGAPLRCGARNTKGAR